MGKKQTLSKLLTKTTEGIEILNMFLIITFTVLYFFVLTVLTFFLNCKA